MKVAQITSYWEKTYATWDNKLFKWGEETKKPTEERFLKIEYSSPTPGMEEIRIIGGPIKTKTYLVAHLLRPPNGVLLISLGVINKFPEVWVLWDDLERVLKEFKNGS